MSDWNATKRRDSKPLPAPDNIIHEIEYRGMRVVCTDDKRLVGQSHPDKWGFTTDRGYIVLDEFDDHVFPAGMHWFYTPDDAVSAIEMRDTILPTIKAGQPATTLLYEYGLMRTYRREFWLTYNAIQNIQRMCDNARDFDENPREEVLKELHLLRQNVAQGRSVG